MPHSEKQGKFRRLSFGISCQTSCHHDAKTLRPDFDCRGTKLRREKKGIW